MWVHLTLQLTADQLTRTVQTCIQGLAPQLGIILVSPVCRGLTSSTQIFSCGVDRCPPLPLRCSSISPVCGRCFCPQCYMEIGTFQIPFPRAFCKLWLWNKGDRKGDGGSSSLQEGLNQQEQRVDFSPVASGGGERASNLFFPGVLNFFSSVSSLRCSTERVLSASLIDHLGIFFPYFPT